jgi:SAM-dependent methyltransferase
MLPDLRDRQRVPELMDEPDLDRSRHVRALRALARVNRVSGVAGRVWREVLDLGLDAGNPVRGQPLRLLDVACGGGDVIVDVARRARSAGLPLEVHGCDVSPVALGYARRQSERAGVAVEFVVWDVLAEGLPRGYDLVCSSLFHHHLSLENAVGLLRGMGRAGRSVLVQDLVRSKLGYVLAWSGIRLLSRSDVARIDGPRSVRSAFTLQEARAMAEEADLRGAVVQSAWPERFVLRWRRS